MNAIQKEHVMIRDIRKKMVILSGRMPFSPQVREFAAHIEKKDWIYRNLKLNGSALREEEVEDLINGSYVLGASVGEHLTAERLEKALGKMRDSVSRGTDMDLKLINTFHNIIAGTGLDTGKGYRKRSLVITEYDYTPAIPSDIPEEMQKLQTMIDEKNQIAGSSEDCFLAAAEIHNMILSIFPYGDEDKILARTAAAYFLMTKGYPAVACDMGEGEYNEAVSEGVKYGRCETLKDSLLKAVLERMDLMLQLTAY